MAGALLGLAVAAGFATGGGERVSTNVLGGGSSGTAITAGSGNRLSTNGSGATGAGIAAVSLVGGPGNVGGASTRRQ
jgi:hypothetical protein